MVKGCGVVLSPLPSPTSLRGGVQHCWWGSVLSLLRWGASVGVTWVSVRQFLSREHRAGSQVVMLFPAQWRNPFQVLAHWWFASGFLSAIQASAGGMVAGSGLSFRLSSITTPCSEIFIWLSKISGMHNGKGMAR